MRNRQSGLLLTSALAVVSLIIVLSSCRGLVADPPGSNLQSVNHIVFMAQENRGFDHYLGAMRKYWASQNTPDQAFDGLPQFNPPAGIAPLQGPRQQTPAATRRFLHPATASPTPIVPPSSRSR